MTRSAIVLSRNTGRQAGEELAAEILESLEGTHPDALLLFASSDQDHSALLEGLTAGCSPGVLVGCSSAGEFTSEGSGVGMTCAVALVAPEMAFSASLGRGLRDDRAAAAQAIVDGFQGLDTPGFRHRAALVLTDALAGFSDDLVDRLTQLTGGVYRFFGGGAGDNGRFKQTVVFLGTEVVTDAAVALEILSNKPIGLGVRHGWQPSGDRMRVTRSEGMKLDSLNAVPAVEIFDAHAEATGQAFDHAEPLPFFLHNVIGVESAQGYRLRVPLGVGDDGSIACASNVTPGATACIMATTPASAAEAAAWATRAALDQMEGHPAALALVFDCVATRLRLGKEFDTELAAVQSELRDVPLAGFNTYGQIAQMAGQFSGFHNCTAVVCTIPQ